MQVTYSIVLHQICNISIIIILDRDKTYINKHYITKSLRQNSYKLEQFIIHYTDIKSVTLHRFTLNPRWWTNVFTKYDTLLERPCPVWTEGKVAFQPHFIYLHFDVLKKC